MYQVDCHDPVFTRKSKGTQYRLDRWNVGRNPVGAVVRPLSCRRPHQKIRKERILRRQPVRWGRTPKLHCEHPQNGGFYIHCHPAKLLVRFRQQKDLRVSAGLRNAAQNCRAGVCVLDRAHLKHPIPPSLFPALPRPKAV